MLHDFFLSADLVEHLIVTHVDNYNFLIMEYSTQKPLQNRKKHTIVPMTKNYILSINVTINIVSFKTTYAMS